MIDRSKIRWVDVGENRATIHTCLDVSDVILHEIADEQLVILFVLRVAPDLLGCHLVEGR